MHSLELDHVEAVGEHTVRFALEKVLGFVRGDVRNCSENVRTVRRGSLDTIAVVDPAFSGLVIDIEVLKIVVEVDATGAEVAAKERSVGGKYRCDIDVTLA